MTDAQPFREGLGANRPAFDIPDEIHYFNTANLSPALSTVRNAAEAAAAGRAMPWRITPSDWFDDVESARALFAELVGSDANHVAIVPSTSYGFAVIARNLTLTAGQTVVVLAEEYPSGIYTWRQKCAETGARLRTVTRDEGQSWTDAVANAMDEHVAVVSVPNVHWTNGAWLDVEHISALTHQIGARLVIDASQSVGALPLDVKRVRPDFIVTVGYKWLLGAFGIGFLWAASEHLEGTPIEHNWILRQDSEDFSRLTDYRDQYQPGARRYDVGERTNFETMPMTVAALDQIRTWGTDRIAASLREVTNQIADAAHDLGLDTEPAEHRAPHLLGVRLPETASMSSSASALLDTLTDANCHAAIRSGTLRIAPHLHTTTEDITALVNALAAGLELD